MNKGGKKNSKDDEFFIPANKEDRKQLLKQYIASHLSDYFMNLPLERAKMERRFLRHLIDTTL